MKLNPKTLKTKGESKNPMSSSSGIGKNVKELEQLLSSLYEERKKVDEKIKDVNMQILDAKLSPFKIGDEVVYDRGDSDIIRGILEYPDSGDFPAIRPYKKDGKLSQRVFYVYTHSKNYSDVLTLTKVGD